jgi:hypothetical protein
LEAKKARSRQEGVESGKKAVLLELLKQKQNEAGNSIGHYARALSVYLLIIGGLLKLAPWIEMQPFPLRHALGLMVYPFGIVGSTAVALAEKQRRHTKVEPARLFEHCPSR